MLYGKCYVIINNLIAPYHFLGIGPRNSTVFTRLFLAERHAQAGHNRSSIQRVNLTPFIM